MEQHRAFHGIAAKGIMKSAEEVLAISDVHVAADKVIVAGANMVQVLTAILPFAVELLTTGKLDLAALLAAIQGLKSQKEDHAGQRAVR